MDINPKIIAHLHDIFENELDEQLQVIVDTLLQLEKGVAQDKKLELFNSAFRAAHNIKGTARSVNVFDVAKIAHHLESLISTFKNQQRNPSAEVTDLCLKSLDTMRKAMHCYKNQTPLPFDLKAICRQLDVAAGTQNDAPERESRRVKTGPNATTTGTEAAEANPVLSYEILKPESISTVEKTISAGYKESVRVSLDKIDVIATLAEELQISKIENDDHLHYLQMLDDELNKYVIYLKRSIGILNTDAPSLPVELRQFLENTNEIVHKLHSDVNNIHKKMHRSNKHLGFLCNDLQNDIRMLQLLPVSTVLKPLQRSARDIARKLGKQVNLTMHGMEIEIDRAVLDGIRAPLTHLLHNAIDYGIELPREREARGKAITGQLNIHVDSKGHEALIRIDDDGAGIDPEHIAKIACQKKLVTRSELLEMDDADKIGLIFHPGFSSRKIVTDVSGRGVGLDVVKSNLQRLKGNVRVNSEAGKGTRFIMRVPITLVADHGLLVKAGGSIYAIPTTSVDRVQELHQDKIIDSEDSHTVMIEERFVPLRHLAHVLETSNDNPYTREQISVVLISKGWDSVAFIVDEIIGEQEIVIKPLLPPLISVRNVIGGAVTSSGDIIMVLNSMDLVDSARHPDIASRININTGATNITPAHILVVDDSITTRTLEKNILENSGYRVSTAVDGIEAWEMLQHEQFALVVSDAEMPLLDGFMLTRQIKQSDKLSNTPVIIVTSLAKESDRQRCLEVDADAYLVKSQFESRVLLDLVAKMV